MGNFLSADWFASINQKLSENVTKLALPSGQSELRVVLEWTDGPGNSPHALTFSATADGATITLGDHIAADALITLRYADALALAEGTLDTASALREGRLKIRGDVQAMLVLAGALRQADAN